MAEIIRMPRMSDTMEEGVIASWLKKVGDEIKSGDVLAEVETDKATMELESYEDGVLLYVGVNEKEVVPVDGVLAILGKKGENIDQILKEIKSEKPTVSNEKPAAKEESKVVENKAAPAEVQNIPATVITMPKMSDTMTEGTIAAWHKKVGDPVKAGDILAEVETDKATMELEAYDDGTLLYVGVNESESIAVDGVIAVIGEKGADYKTLLSNRPEKPRAKEEPEAAVKDEKQAAPSGPAPVPASVESAADRSGRIVASPLAKKMAKEKGLDISRIKGSGDHGRIIKRDIESFKEEDMRHVASASGATGQESIQLPSIVGEESYQEIKVSQMRKTIAKRLSESKFTAPHFYLTMEINMDKTMDARAGMNEFSPVKISFNDIILKAVASSLRKHPKVNSSWLGDRIRYNQHIHIGVAVAVDEGLIVPVVRFADNKSLSHIAAEVKELSTKAREKQLQPNDWEGNTFTISNLGMFGIEELTAIINPPDACILAIGGIKQTPIVKDGQIVPGNVMKVTLSCDHRVVDGATGAAFLQTLKSMLEDPVRILV